MIERIVILIGPPGSGKGTLARKLVEHHQFHHLSTGWILQHQIADSTLKQRLAAIWQSGQLVDDVTMTRLLLDIVKQSTESRLILDGYPRNYTQHQLLMQALTESNWPQPTIVILDADLAICRQRIAQRLVCQRCQAVYHQTFAPPRFDKQCDYDQTPLKQRTDQHQTERRLRVYRQKTLPLINWYLNQKSTHQLRLLVVPAAQTPAQVYQTVAQFLELK